MAKLGSEGFMLKHGEKLVMGVGGLFALVLMISGITEALSAKSAKDYVKELETATATINNQLKADGAPAPPLDDWQKKPTPIEQIPNNLFALRDYSFAPYFRPDNLRDQPRVLAFRDTQVDAFVGPVKVRDVEIEPGPDGRPRIARYAVRELKGGSVGNAVKRDDDISKREADPVKGPKPSPRPGNKPPKGNSTPTGGTTEVVSGQRNDPTVRYLTPEQATNEKNIQFADTVYPLRGVLVHAAFPLKDQLQEIRLALRAVDEAEAIKLSSAKIGEMKEPLPGPVLTGFDVQRRVFEPDSDLANPPEWVDFDHKQQYRNDLFLRRIQNKAGKYEYEAPPEGLTSFIPHPRQELWYPLPKLVDQLGEYPTVRMPSVLAAAKGLADSNVKGPTAEELEKKFSTDGKDDLFDSSAGKPTGPTPTPTAPAPSTTPAKGPVTTPELALIRFIDTDVKPGYRYQYRLRIRLHNPNYQVKTGVSRAMYTTEPELLGEWQDVTPGNQSISLPTDAFMYAYDGSDYKLKVDELYERYHKEPKIKKVCEYDDVREGRQAVVQIQNWMAQIRLDGSGNKVEPVGTWVVAEIPVEPGEYIGRRQLVELPLWSAALSEYVLRELSGNVKIYGINDVKKQPKGWPINFRSNSFLVDFHGGMTKTKIGTTNYEDDSETELLITNPDGTLTVMSTAVDRENPNRAGREKTWEKWLERVRGRREDSPKESGTKDRFDRQK